jgi:phage terminase large subunit GpA-like protein
MARCDQCGNDYDKSFEVMMAGETYAFDSFECAVQKLAPICPHCSCKIIGHGVEQDDVIYCCAHCAAQSGATGLTDRVP